MPNLSGMWTSRQQMQARGSNIWPAVPGAPTIGTASQASATSASVTFTPPSDTGYPTALTYTVTSSPGGLTGTGASSPITVSGLTTGTAYTFTVTATNTIGTSPASAASNSFTPAVVGQQAYTTAGTYSWVAPAGVTSVSVVCVGAGGSDGGGGGGLGWKNNITVVPGSSYSVVVGAGGVNTTNGSHFINTATVRGGGGAPFSTSTGGTYTGDGGGNGGNGAGSSGAGGAGGYSGNGGNGNPTTAGSGGGGGGGPTIGGSSYFGGGGVGILGQGANGAAGTSVSPPGGGSGGQNGSTTVGALYGGSGSWNFRTSAGGAVRIIWPGTFRSFPSTNTGDL